MSADKNPRVRGFSLPEIDQEGLALFLRGIYARDTAGCVADDTGLPISTIRNWLEYRNTPKLGAALLLFAVYGPDVLKALWPGSVPRWLDVAVQDEALARNEAEFHRLAAERAAITSQKVGP